MYKITATTEANGSIQQFNAKDSRELYAIERQLRMVAGFSLIVVEKCEAMAIYEWARYTITPEANIAQRMENARQGNEKRVFKKVVESAIRLGYMVSLFDGEEYTVKRSTVKPAILAAGQTTDLDRLSFRRVSTGEAVGSVLFVYGNLGSEVINDYTDSPEMSEILADATAYTDKLSARGE